MIAISVCDAALRFCRIVTVPGFMLRSVVGAEAANMMLVQIRFRCTHLNRVLAGIGSISLDHGIIGTASRVRDLADLR